MKTFSNQFQLLVLSTLMLAISLNAQSKILSGNGAACNKIVSVIEDPTPAQITGGTLPSIASSIVWLRPALTTSKGAFSGTTGAAASHEGVDYINNDQSVPEVVIRAVADGKVVYVREGCEQSSMFEHNNTTREAGAGWGNHIVIIHKDLIYTRYGHLLKNSIKVNNGDSVKAGQVIAIMGNSGRSELRHMHFEVGTKSSAFDPCGMSQNFDKVYNPEQLAYSTGTGINTIKLNENDIRIYPNPIKNNFNLLMYSSTNSNLNVDLIDVAGHKISTIFNGEINAGDLNLNFNISANSRYIAQGIYFLKIKNGHFSKLIKIQKTI
jgi:murein DD-endopeptidase MepM/ murein hydrolase activator NlpD